MATGKIAVFFGANAAHYETVTNCRHTRIGTAERACIPNGNSCVDNKATLASNRPAALPLSSHSHCRRFPTSNQLQRAGVRRIIHAPGNFYCFLRTRQRRDNNVEILFTHGARASNVNERFLTAVADHPPLQSHPVLDIVCVLHFCRAS